jgi:hypothetical protein
MSESKCFYSNPTVLNFGYFKFEFVSDFEFSASDLRFA